MIKVEIYKDSQGTYKGYSIKGHAGYAEYGNDIICAAVSVLAQNTANSIEKFTDDAIEGSIDENTGFLSVSFLESVSKESALLLDSMILGLTGIMEDYGKKYIDIQFKKA